MFISTKNILSIFLILFFVFQSQGAVEVAFFQYIDQNGKVLSFEENGIFFHTAIKTKDGWLSAGIFGVRLDKDIKDVSANLAVIIKNPNMKTITKTDYEKYLGLPFDREFKWNDQTSTYCSKLVANILGIEPQPLSNTSIKTDLGTIVFNDTVGISPDEIYKILSEDHDFSNQTWKCHSIFQ